MPTMPFSPFRPPPAPVPMPMPAQPASSSRKSKSKMKGATRKAPLFLPTLLLLLLTTALAFPANMTTYLNVPLPSALTKSSPGGYQHRTSRFGRRLFRSAPHGSMSLGLYLTQTDLCSSAEADNRSAFLPHAPPSPIPFALMTTRGNCSFVTKTRNAQRSGAAVLLIADDACLCTNPECVGNMTSNDPPCQNLEPTVSDDGSGGDVTIPAFLLHKMDADGIGKAVTDGKGGPNSPVLVDVRWHPPRVEERVNWTAWLDLDPMGGADGGDGADGSGGGSDGSNGGGTYTASLLADLRPVALALGSARAKFQPHFVLRNGTELGCVGNAVERACVEGCTNGGRYCYPTPTAAATSATAASPGEVGGGVAGYKVVAEVLRRACIWKHHGAPDPDDAETDGGVGQQAWWDYVTHFDASCAPSNATYDNPACLKECYDRAKVSVADVDECMKDSGDIAEDVPNALLDEELRVQREEGIYVAPTVRVNHGTVTWPRGPSAKTVLEAICDGYLDGGGSAAKTAAGSVTTSGKPDVCVRCTGSDDVVTCASNLGPAPAPPPSGGAGGKKGHFWRNTFLFLLLVGGGAGFVYWKKLREEGGGGGHGVGSLRYAMLGDQDD